MMKYIVDHDFHIHSRLSSCSDDPRQTPKRIVELLGLTEEDKFRIGA